MFIVRGGLSVSPFHLRTVQGISPWFMVECTNTKALTAKVPMQQNTLLPEVTQNLPTPASSWQLSLGMSDSSSKSRDTLCLQYASCRYLNLLHKCKRLVVGLRYLLLQWLVIYMCWVSRLGVAFNTHSQNWKSAQLHNRRHWKCFKGAWKSN